MKSYHKGFEVLRSTCCAFLIHTATVFVFGKGWQKLIEAEYTMTAQMFWTSGPLYSESHPTY
jgi:hypothetical protein